MMTYPTPLAGREWLTAPELSKRLKSQAAYLTHAVRARYARLGVPDSYADAAHREHTAHMAYAYLALTGDYPEWASPNDCAPYAVPAWVDAL